MSSFNEQNVVQILAGLTVPHLEKDWVSIGAIKQIELDGDQVSINLELPFPCAGLRDQLVEQVEQALKKAGFKAVSVDLGWLVPGNERSSDAPGLKEVKNIVAVASGKGGVGKSTTAVNLALALVKEGASVGLLDADIYGPSQQVMLGVPEDQKPRQQDGFILPIKTYGLQTMSLAYLTPRKAAMVWRGPMAGSALQQMLTQTAWGDLDYLIVDMPPGTGDIQLTLSQEAPIAGAVIVTTPQDIALLDAVKGIEMFSNVEVPVLGIVENMAVHICSECGHQEHLFGFGGGEVVATDYGVPLLGALPLDMQIREQVDSGNPTVAQDPEGDISQLYRQVARQMAAQLALQNSAGDKGAPTITISED